MLIQQNSPAADNFLNKMARTDKRVADKIARKINQICLDPAAAGTKRLTSSGYQRARVGSYRIIYRISSDKMHVAFIGNRKDAYEKFQRLTRH